jgi:SAM-dependent methyltransferase
MRALSLLRRALAAQRAVRSACVAPAYGGIGGETSRPGAVSFPATRRPKPVGNSPSIQAACQRRMSSRRRSSGRLAAASAPPAPSDTGSTAATDGSEPSTSTPGTIYSRPDLYDLAFSYRDFKSEVAFLQAVYKAHAGGRPLGSVLELGSGPAHHLAGLARAGVPRLVGIDASPDMLTHAQKLLDKLPAKARGAVTLVETDMASPQLPEPHASQPFDMVMCLLGTFSHMLDTKQAIACIASAAARLRPGGLLLLEMAHPGDLFDGTLIIGTSPLGALRGTALLYGCNDRVALGGRWRMWVSGKGRHC